MTMVIMWLNRLLGIASPSKVCVALIDWHHHCGSLNAAELRIAVDIVESRGVLGQFWTLAYDGAEVLR